MKVVSIGPAPPWRGGISHYHFALVRELRALGVEVEVLNFLKLYPRLFFPGTSAADWAPDAFSPLGEMILRPMAPWTWRRGAAWVKSQEPDTVLFHWWHPFFGPTYLGLLNRVPPGASVGFVCHNVEAHEGMPGGGWMGRRTLGRGDYFIAGGDGMASELRRLKPEAAVEVVLHPRYDLPYTEFMPSREEARVRMGIDHDGPLFLFFGLVREYKGLDTLIDALAMLPEEATWTCIVAGEFYIPIRPYEEQIAHHRLGRKIKLEDRYIPNDQVPWYFAAADVVVLPYHTATQSGVAALSFALHRPVLTTSVGALPEMINEGREGWLVPPQDPEALSERLAAVLEDRATARLPVCEGDTGLPGWGELAGSILRLGGLMQESGDE